MSEGWPEEWEGEMGKVRVIERLRVVPISWREKKAALFEWCRQHDVELTARDIERATGRPAGEV